MEAPNAMCVDHGAALRRIAESTQRNEERTAAILRLLENVEPRLTALELAQADELRYWRLGRRIALWAGAPAILGWVAYAAAILKGSE